MMVPGREPGPKKGEERGHPARGGLTQGAPSECRGCGESICVWKGQRPRWEMGCTLVDWPNK